MGESCCRSWLREYWTRRESSRVLWCFGAQHWFPSHCGALLWPVEKVGVKESRKIGDIATRYCFTRVVQWSVPGRFLAGMIAICLGNCSYGCMIRVNGWENGNQAELSTRCDLTSVEDTLWCPVKTCNCVEPRIMFGIASYLSLYCPPPMGA